MNPGDRNSAAEPQQTPPKSPARPPVVKIDNALRKHTQAVEVEKLNQLGVTTINFISLSKINQLISLAVHKAFEKYQRTWNDSEAAKIQDEVRAEVEKRLLRRRQADEALDADLAGGPLEGAVEALEEQRRTLKSDVEELRPAIESRVRELEAEKQRDPGPWSMLCSEEGLADLDKLVRRSVADAIASVRQDADQPFAIPLDRLEADLREIIRKVVADERQRIEHSSAEDSAQKTEILEKRLEKLKIHLAEMEETLKRMAVAKGIDAGLPSFFRDIQGLQLEDNHFAKKKGMLKAIFDENVKLQGIACAE